MMKILFWKRVTLEYVHFYDKIQKTGGFKVPANFADKMQEVQNLHFMWKLFFLKVHFASKVSLYF
jgi:hypothetical protein